MEATPEGMKRAVEIDRLLSRANVHRSRGELIEAEDALREALTLDENRLDVREFLADMLYARGQLEAAAAEYKSVLAVEPGLVTAQTKYAKTVLEIGDREYEKKLAQEMLENPEKHAPPPKHPLAAFALSLLAPGVGQMYNGEFLKGGIILGVFAFMLLLLALAPIEFKNLLINVGALLNPGGLEGKPPPVGIVAPLACCAIIATYVYAVIDAPITAAKIVEPKRRKLVEPGQSKEDDT